MFATLLVWTAFALILVSAPLRPWIGVAGYYAFVLAMPKWNWPWAAPLTFSFELYIVLATLIGVLLNLRLDALKHTPTRNAILGIGMFVGLGTLSLQQSLDPPRSAHTFDSMWKIWFMAALSLIVVQSLSQVRLIMWCATIAHTYNAFKITTDYFSLGWCRYVQDGWGINTGSNQASLIAVAAFCISMALIVTETHTITRWLAVLCAAFQGHEIMLLESRGGMIGATVALGIVALMVPKSPKMIFLFLVIAGLGATMAGPSVLKEFSSSFTGTEDLDDSARSRFYTWKAGLRVAWERPLLGSGPAASGLLIARYYEPGWDGKMKNAHNQPIEIAADYGYPATLVYYFVVLLAPVHFALRWLKYRGALATLPGYFVAIAGIPGTTLATLTSSGLMVEAYYLLIVVALLSLFHFDSLDLGEYKGEADDECNPSIDNAEYLR